MKAEIWLFSSLLYLQAKNRAQLLRGTQYFLVVYKNTGASLGKF